MKLLEGDSKNSLGTLEMSVEETLTLIRYLSEQVEQVVVKKFDVSQTKVIVNYPHDAKFFNFTTKA